MEYGVSSMEWAQREEDGVDHCMEDCMEGCMEG